MNRLNHSLRNRKLREQRVRSKVIGTSERPRLSVHISNKHIQAQIIDDENGTTLVYVSTIGQKLNGTMSERAKTIGKDVAKKALKANIKSVVFDRGSKLYHGRVKVLADAAREEGLEF